MKGQKAWLLAGRIAIIPALFVMCILMFASLGNVIDINSPTSEWMTALLINNPIKTTWMMGLGSLSVLIGLANMLNVQSNFVRLVELDRKEEEAQELIRKALAVKKKYEEALIDLHGKIITSKTTNADEA